MGNTNFDPRLLSSPASAGADVAPSDSADLPTWARALYIGVGGDVKVTLADGLSTLTFIAVPQGSILPVQARRVWLTGTTAGSIEALY